MKPDVMTWEQYASSLETNCFLFEKKIAQLEAELERKTECIHIMEDDTACLPENTSVTEYVTLIRRCLQQAEAERDALEHARGIIETFEEDNKRLSKESIELCNTILSFGPKVPVELRKIARKQIEVGE